MLRLRGTIALLLLLGLTACANMQISESAVESTVIQILGIAFLAWLVLLFV